MPIGMALVDAGPWAGWDSARYFPARRLLHVPDGAWVRVTPAEAAMIGADARPTRSAGGRSAALPMAVALGGCAAVAIAARRRLRWRLRRA